ncbi:MAG: hypothetical protein ACSLE9_07895 [Burkholderiaceae bacterium]
MASGGVYHAFTTADNITPGTNRTLRYPVRNAAGTLYSSFAGWEFEWFALRNAWDANGLDALRASNLATKVHADIDSSVPPNADVDLLPADLLGLRGILWHELWRVDDGNVERLSYGPLPLVD